LKFEIEKEKPAIKLKLRLQVFTKFLLLIILENRARAPRPSLPGH
jgi:hypothetical protein